MKATKGDKGDNGDEGDERNVGDAAQKILQIYAQMFAHIFVEKYAVQKIPQRFKAVSLYGVLFKIPIQGGRKGCESGFHYSIMEI